MERKIVLKIETYEGDDSSLQVEFWNPGTGVEGEMWVIVTLDEQGQPLDDLTDYGYRTREEALAAAQH